MARVTRTSFTSLAYNDVLQMPMLGVCMHPGGLELVCHSEDCAGDAEFVFCTFTE